MLLVIVNKFWKQHPTKQQLYGYLHPINKAYWALLEKKGQTHVWRSSMDSYVWTHLRWPNSKGLHLFALCKHWIQSRGRWSIGTAGVCVCVCVCGCERERENKSNPCCGTHWWWWWWWFNKRCDFFVCFSKNRKFTLCDSFLLHFCLFVCNSCYDEIVVPVQAV